MRLRPLSLVLSLLCLVGVSAEETAPAAAVASEPAAAPATAPEPTAEQLKALLPAVPTLSERQGGLWWDDGKGSSYRIVALDDKGQARLEAEIGQVAVPRKLIADGRTDALTALPKLVAQAQAGKATEAAYTLAEGIMTGIHLRSPEVLVLSEGVLRKVPAPTIGRGAEITRLEQLIGEGRKALGFGGWLLAFLLVLQVTLGVEAWMGKFGLGMMPELEVLTKKDMAKAVTRTLHTLIGSGILATTAALIVRTGVVLTSRLLLLPDPTASNRSNAFGRMQEPALIGGPQQGVTS